MSGRPRARCPVLPAAAVGLAMMLAISPDGSAQDAPLFTRPFDGVPVPALELFLRIVPLEQINFENDDERQLDVGGGPDSLPAALPPRFTDDRTMRSTTGMTAGGSYFGQFVAHDLTLTRLRFDELLIEPFVFRYHETEGSFQNKRTPGFDLDPLYRISPLEYPSTPENLGPWDLSNLRFRFSINRSGALDFIRGGSGIAIIGDPRNDITGVIGQLHRAFMKLHNVQVDKIIIRDRIDEASLEFLSEQWWDIFNEARNYTTAYYQGIVCNELAQQLTGRTLFEAIQDPRQPLGPVGAPHVTVEFAGGAFRLHTLIPTDVQVAPDTFLDPLDEQLRNGVPWPYLFGPTAPLAGKLDAAVAAPLRQIVSLIIPGTQIPITLDLAQVNLLRGREMKLPSGEEYLALLMDELRLDPKNTSAIRGKLILTPRTAAAILDPRDDADLLADIANGDTDLWAYILIEGELNDGVLGPVGQDIIERNWAELLLADDWSLLGKYSDQFTPTQMDFFRSATFGRLIDEILSPADFNRDGRVGILDLLFLLAEWGESDSPADLNADGTVDVADLILLWEEWGF